MVDLKVCPLACVFYVTLRKDRIKNNNKCIVIYESIAQGMDTPI